MAETERPARFYDNRQKYLSFVTTCNEKWKIAERAIRELNRVTPTPPAMRIFDAGMGDGTLLSHVMRSAHKRFPTVPMYVVGKEISLEDVRLGLEKLPDRFVEHPSTVVVLTNLNYSESPWLRANNPDMADEVNWIEAALPGNTAAEFGERLRSLDPKLVDGWAVRTSEKTGNPLYVKPTVLVLYREDHRFSLDPIMPRYGETTADYDLILVSQPWRASASAEFKVDKVLAPIVGALAANGRALIAQSAGNDPGLELIREIWPDANPFTVTRHDLIEALKVKLGDAVSQFEFHSVSDAESIVSYRMHTLPAAFESSIGTSTLFAAWNAAVYVAQIADERLEDVITSGEYLEITEGILRRFGGLWFNDETFVVSRRADS